MGFHTPPHKRQPSGWIRAIDEALVFNHIDVANENDDYDTAKHKLNLLLCHEQSIGAYFAAAHAQQQAALTEAPGFISHMSADFSCDGGGVRVYIASRVDDWLRAHGIPAATQAPTTDTPKG